MYSEFVRVPKDRIAVLIGKNGSAKRGIEKKTKSRISIESANGEVEISSKEALLGLKAASIIKAVARGFSPERAMQLINDDYILDVIDISEFVGKSEKAIAQRKSRIIGAKGTAREAIEELTGTEISAYGKTVSIIGSAEDAEIAHEAIEMLIRGAEHKTVYDFLERRTRFESNKKFEL